MATLTMPLTRLEDEPRVEVDDGGLGWEGLNRWKRAVDGRDDSERSENAVWEKLDSSKY